MSRFFSDKYARLVPYTPGEQPRDMKYVKLNTNESPFPPSEYAVEAARREAARLELYPAPDPAELCRKFAAAVGVRPTEVIAVNGSDEIHDFAFKCFCDKLHPAVFPDITYGFYRILAGVHRVPCAEIPLREDFTLALSDYRDRPGTVFLANPNAPTGIPLKRDEIARFCRTLKNVYFCTPEELAGILKKLQEET